MEEQSPIYNNFITTVVAAGSTHNLDDLSPGLLDFVTVVCLSALWVFQLMTHWASSALIL